MSSTPLKKLPPLLSDKICAVSSFFRTPLKKLPPLLSDADAEKFVEEADLSKYDLSEFKAMHFEFEPKSASLNMRLPQSLLDAVKATAKAHGVPYTRFIRKLLEQGVSKT